MPSSSQLSDKAALFTFLLRMGDNTLILGHRISEWCGHGPVIEEDIALANTALDLIGQTQMWLGLAAEIEDQGRSADDLAFLRDVMDFKNLLLVELPNGDFGRTLLRQFLFDAWHSLQLRHLKASSHVRIAEVAEKAHKEVRYHLERSSDLVIGLGDGTEESHANMQAALTFLHPYIGEMFEVDAVDEHLAASGIAPLPSALRPDFDALLEATMHEATLDLPDSSFSHKGGRTAFRHTEHLGHLLTQMQWLQRAYPGATW